MSERRRRRCIGVPGVGIVCGVRGLLSARDRAELVDMLGQLQAWAQREERELRSRWIRKLCRVVISGRCRPT